MASVQQLSNPQSGIQNLSAMSTMQPQMQAQYPMQYQPDRKKYGLGKRIGRGIKHFFAGRSEKLQQVPTVTPEVMQVLSKYCKEDYKDFRIL